VRVRGGTRGLLAAIEAGVVDPATGYVEEEPDLGPMSGADRRAIDLERHRRARKLAKRLPF
jgi:hypothetical protein